MFRAAHFLKCLWFCGKLPQKYEFGKGKASYIKR